MILYETVRKRLGFRRGSSDCECTGVEQDERRRHRPLQTQRANACASGADVVIACDGINSAIRKQFYPQDKVAFAGINTWRGVTRRKPILGGRTICASARSSPARS